MQLLEKPNREDYMVEGTSVEADGFAEFEAFDPGLERYHSNILLATPEREQIEPTFHLRVSTPACIRLALEELKCFEVVEHQFENWGATFTNAIAIQPSNPAFFTRPGATVLMGAPKSGLIEVSFKRPVRFISGLVTSSRRTVLSAYDQDGTVIAQSELPAPNLVGSHSPIPPNAPLSVKAANIYRASFYAFDGQLIVDELSFGLELG